MKAHKQADRVFLWIVGLFVFLGSIIFVSAWLGLLAREQTGYNGVLFTHAISVVLGIGVLIGASNIPHSFWKKYSFYIFLFTFILTLLVFIPGLGVTHGGAQRWIYILGFSLQPAELLKIGFIVYFAALLSSLKDNINSLKDGILPMALVFIAIGFVLLSQPDTGTLVVMFAAGVGMFIAAGGYWRYIVGFASAGVLGLVALAFARPYVMERFLTFFDPSRDALNAGWQIKQSLIAIGSGGIFGRGFGQSVQKFNYLPEPIGDSIFAVAGEEFGFIGATLIILLFVLLASRGFYIAKRAQDQFGGLVVVGIVILILSQSFINIGGMLGVLPLKGIPLVFISHGGTALMVNLLAMGIILNISKDIKT